MSYVMVYLKDHMSFHIRPVLTVYAAALAVALACAVSADIAPAQRTDAHDDSLESYSDREMDADDKRDLADQGPLTDMETFRFLLLPSNTLPLCFAVKCFCSG